MRIWDISPEFLCNKHLFGEHRELHAIWSIIINNKKGYSNHPETKRWKGKTKALFLRHEELKKEIVNRGYNHWSDLDHSLACGPDKQDCFLHTIEEQKEILRDKKCECYNTLNEL